MFQEITNREKFKDVNVYMQARKHCTKAIWETKRKAFSDLNVRLGTNKENTPAHFIYIAKATKNKSLIYVRYTKNENERVLTHDEEILNR